MHVCVFVCARAMYMCVQCRPCMFSFLWSEMLVVTVIVVFCSWCFSMDVVYVVWLEILVMLRARPGSPPSLWTSASAVRVQLASSLDMCSVLYLWIQIKVAYSSNSLCYLCLLNNSSHHNITWCHQAGHRAYRLGVKPCILTQEGRWPQSVPEPKASEQGPQMTTPQNTHSWRTDPQVLRGQSLLKAGRQIRVLVSTTPP